MKYFLLPLRLTIPAILLLMGCVAGGVSYRRQVSLTQERVIKEVTQQARQTATTTAQLLEFLYRRADLQNSQAEGVSLLISRLAGDRDLKIAVFCDEHHQILSASRYELQNHHLRDTALSNLISIAENVQRDRAGQIAINQSDRTMQAIYPVLLPPQKGQLRSNRVGTILLNYDLSQAEQQAILDASYQSLEIIGTLGVLCILVGVLLDRIVTQRARSLVSASNKLAEGNFDIRVNLNGADELVQIGKAFNLMAAQIQQYTESLQTSEHKFKAQTQELQSTLQELNQTQAQLIQREKMSSLGQLVAGVAHEINNPVNFIHANLPHVQTYSLGLLELIQLYQSSYPEPEAKVQAKAEEIDLEFLQEDLLKLLNSMQVGTDRIRQIVLSLRNFARMDEADLKTVDLHQGIESTLLILQHRLKSTAQRPEITIVRDYGDLPPVECYSGQLNQVLMNIFVNAIDALEEKMKGSEPAPTDTSYQIKIQTSVVDSYRVAIAIADNGTGMPDAVREQVFNPFFTTKPVGKGTGMGMSISYQIITQKHHGKLECFSTPGVGTRFLMQIPIQQQIG